MLTLHYIDDLPLAEIGRVLGLPLGTVKSRLAYGLKLMRERIVTDPRGPTKERGGTR